MRDVKTVRLGKARENVQVILEGGPILEAPPGTTLETFFRAAERLAGYEFPAQLIAAVVDGRLRELSYRVERDVRARPVTMRESDGTRIYRRSLSFLLIVATEELFPGTQVVIEHSIPEGGFYCTVLGRPPFSRQELAAIKKRMQEIVEADEPIHKEIVPLEKAVEIFRSQGDEDKLRLMESRRKDYLVMYTLRGRRDYFYGYMVPSTGYLKVFDLEKAEGGFTLRFPRREHPDQIQPATTSPKLTSVFLRTAEWLRLLEIEDVGRLNQSIRNGRILEIILVSEALHEQHVAQIATDLAKRHKDGVRLALIAGPSSSGKTTFARRLAVQLMAHGLKPFPIGLDDFFVDRDKTPRDEHGDYDYERLEALNLELFNECLLDLMAGRKVQLPRYDFKSGKSLPGKVVQLSPSHILIVEGIHGMNPTLVKEVPDDRIFRIYVSALTQLNIDRHNRVPTTDVRLLRRIVRDATYRGYTAEETLARWESVRRGERLYIFPYQENADEMFNSALVYELSVLRPLAEPLLLQVEPGTPRHIEAKRLLAFLRWVEPMKADMVPANSLLREFIGGSVLRHYTPGQPFNDTGKRPIDIGAGGVRLSDNIL